MGPPGPPGEAQAYPSELMGAGKPLLLSGRRKRSVTDHPPVLNLHDLEADFEIVVIDTSEKISLVYHECIHGCIIFLKGPMGPPGPPGEAQAYPSELMGAGKPLLLSGRRKRSVSDHPPVINLPDLEADFETVVIDISENRLSLKEGVHLFVDKMWNHIVKVSHKNR